jgi:hypothetical protein
MTADFKVVVGGLGDNPHACRSSLRVRLSCFCERVTVFLVAQFGTVGF